MNCKDRRTRNASAAGHGGYGSGRVTGARRDALQAQWSAMQVRYMKTVGQLSAFLTTRQTTAITGKIHPSINAIAIAAD
jgi:hypothetical protein